MNTPDRLPDHLQIGSVRKARRAVGRFMARGRAMNAGCRSLSGEDKVCAERSDAMLGGISAVWLATLSMLHRYGSDAAPDKEATTNNVACAGYRLRDTSSDVNPSLRASFVFSHVERVSPNLVLISWHAATLGRYSDQRWIRTSSRAVGNCALSGLPIVRGSKVYRPAFRSANAPCNAGAMILETSIDDRLKQTSAVLGLNDFEQAMI